jgi:hypothetical protein
MASILLCNAWGVRRMQLEKTPRLLE